MTQILLKLYLIQYIVHNSFVGYLQLVECCQYIIFNMFGVSESREPIKGEFAKKLIEEVQRMLKLKKEGKDLHFENKDREIHHNIIREDDI